jgi:hypothetical protein
MAACEEGRLPATLVRTLGDLDLVLLGDQDR